jgi:hypothetical protein
MNNKFQKTIEKRLSEDKLKVLENLKQVPIISVASQKAGIGRSSFYRWLVKDKFFSKEVDKALQEGKQLINDLAESQLINAIKEQNMTGIIWWLRNNHPGYADKIELTHKTAKEELTGEQKELVKKAIALTQGNKFVKTHDKK